MSDSRLSWGCGMCNCCRVWEQAQRRTNPVLDAAIAWRDEKNRTGERGILSPCGEALVAAVDELVK